MLNHSDPRRYCANSNLHCPARAEQTSHKWKCMLSRLRDPDVNRPIRAHLQASRTRYVTKPVATAANRMLAPAKRWPSCVLPASLASRSLASNPRMSKKNQAA
eukprot:3438305-Rhodomonas_salina.2